MKPLRILIGEEYELIRRALRWLIEQQPCWQICAEAMDAPQTLALARELSPDVVILDLSMPGMNGLEATREIRQAMPQIKVIVLVRRHSEELVRNVMFAGAQGYLAKSDTPSLLVTAIEAVSQGLPFFATSLNPELAREEQSCCRSNGHLPSLPGRVHAG